MTRARRAVTLVLLVLAAVWGLGVFRASRDGSFPHVGDWDQYLTFFEIQRRSLLDHGELPWWNPWLLGGIPGVAHPQFTVFSPFFLPVLLFGTVGGACVAFALHVLVGMAGVYRLARHLERDRATALFAAVVFLAVFHPYVIAGVVNRVNGSLVPWLLLGFLKAKRSARGVALVAAVVALLLLEGGFYALFGGALLVGLAACFEGRPKAIAVCLARFGAGVALGVALAGIRFLPTIELYARFPRDSGIYAGQPLWDASRLATFPAALAALFGANRVGQREALFGQDLFLGVDLGLPLLTLLVACLFVGSPLLPSQVPARRRAQLFTLFGVTLVMVLGSASPLNLWAALTRLPGVQSFRVPMSNLFVPFVPLALLLADAAQASIESIVAPSPAARPSRGFREPRAIAWGILALAAFTPFAIQAATLFDGLAREPASPSSGPATPFVQTRGDQNVMLPSIRANQGVVVAYEEVIRSRLEVAALPREAAGYHGEWYLASSGLPLPPRTWSPNVLEFVWDGRHADRLVVNQNHLSGWIATWEGGAWPVASADGRIAVDLPAQAGTLDLRYAPRSRQAGALLSAAAAVAFLALFTRIGRHLLDART